MIKRSALTAVLAASLLYAGYAAADDALTEHKCYIKATDGGYHVVLNMAANLADAKGFAGDKRVKAKSKGGGKTTVAEVIECKRIDEAFSSYEGRALDQKTPR